jgi:hypothetical protein
MILIDKKGHLNEEGIALIAEGLMDAEVYKRIPDHLLDHIDECLECKQKVLVIYDIIRNDEETRDSVSMKYAKTGQPQASLSSVKRWIFPKRNIAWISAAALVIIFLGFYFITKSFRQTSYEQLFSEYFSPYQNLLTMKGDSANNGSDAMYFYDMKMWDSANIYFYKAKAKGMDETALNFYHANALLAQHNAKEAILYFELVINGDDERFRTQAKWYLALAYLQINHIEESRKLLTQLLAITDVYSEKAKELLERIK